MERLATLAVELHGITRWDRLQERLIAQPAPRSAHDQPRTCQCPRPASARTAHRGTPCLHQQNHPLQPNPSWCWEFHGTILEMRHSLEREMAQKGDPKTRPGAVQSIEALFAELQGCVAAMHDEVCPSYALRHHAQRQTSPYVHYPCP